MLTILKKQRAKEREMRLLVLYVWPQRRALARCVPPSPERGRGTRALTRQRERESAPPGRHWACTCRGLDNAGKTTLVKQLLHEDVSTVSPTVGFKIESVAHRGSVRACTPAGGAVGGSVFIAGGRPDAAPRFPGHRYTLNIWDVGGQRSIRSFWRNYFEQTDGIVWVVDAADPVRLRDCRRELHALLQEEVGALGRRAVDLPAKP